MKETSNTSSGKVCAKHPELQGLRYVPNRICVECSKARSRAVHAKRTMTVPQELTMLRSQLRDSTAECEALRKALHDVVNGDVGQSVVWKLRVGQGTETRDGKAWLAACDLLSVAIDTAKQEARL
jgi:hypothetical protein